MIDGVSLNLQPIFIEVLIGFCMVTTHTRVRYPGFNGNEKKLQEEGGGTLDHPLSPKWGGSNYPPPPSSLASKFWMVNFGPQIFSSPLHTDSGGGKYLV